MFEIFVIRMITYISNVRVVFVNDSCTMKIDIDFISNRI